VGVKKLTELLTLTICPAVSGEGRKERIKQRHPSLLFSPARGEKRKKMNEKG
jgi:hypothetical protein